MVLFADGHPDFLGVQVDPGSPTVWRREPYYSQLKELAQRVDEKVRVVVYIKKRAIVILPDREVDMGVLDPGDRIYVSRKAGRFDAHRVPESEDSA
jgi:hypothetical protein